MSVFVFSIKTKSGKTYTCEPKELRKFELSDLDRFSMDYTLFDLEEYFKKELNINDQIDKICIINIRKPEIEYSLVKNNDYVRGIINDLSIEKVDREKYSQNVVMINKDNKVYQEMRDYLFTNLDSNSDFFFKSIYTRENFFSNLLKRYASIAKQKDDNIEDSMDKMNLMHEIEKELRIYNNYRGLAISREMTKNGNYRFKTQKRQEVVEMPIIDYQDNISTFTSSSDEEVYEDYEFITEDEMSKMAGEGNAIKGYRKRS